MRGNEQKHDKECNDVSRVILDKWKNGKWLNNFIANDVRIVPTPTKFPAPDQCFYSTKTQQKLALEYKPIRETKRGILTGYGQTLAYLKRQANSASALVIPSHIKKNNENFPIAEYMQEIFYEQIYNKLPVALFCFENENPSNVIMLCNIGEKLMPKKKFKDKDFGSQYWAAWREDYPSHINLLLKTAHKEKYTGESRISRIWKNFYTNYYCTPFNTNKNLKPENSKIFVWGNEPHIWRKKEKEKLVKYVQNGIITEKEAIIKLLWDSSKSKEEMNKYWESIKSFPKDVKVR